MRGREARGPVLLLVDGRGEVRREVRAWDSVVLQVRWLGECQGYTAVRAERVHVPVHGEGEVDEDSLGRHRLGTTRGPRGLSQGISDGVERERFMLDLVLRPVVAGDLHVPIRARDLERYAVGRIRCEV